MLSILVFGVLVLPTLAQFTESQTFRVISGSTFCQVNYNCVYTTSADNGNYTNNESCDIKILQSGMLVTSYFSTEHNYDQLVLTDNDGGITTNNYSGDTGPGLYVSGGAMLSWHTDSAKVARGWRLCLSDPGVTTTTIESSTTSQPTDHATDAFVLVEGINVCQVSGSCMWRANYLNSEDCVAYIRYSGYLNSVNFHTEQSYDVLRIGNHNFSGDAGPSNLAVTANTPVQWHTDYSQIMSGWRICVGDHPQQQEDGPILRISDGHDCFTDSNGCVRSSIGNRNFYSNNAHCTVQVMTEGTLTATRFSTEEDYDVLYVGGSSWSGTIGPDHYPVITGDIIRWSTDQNTVNSGWTICLQPRHAVVVETGQEYCHVTQNCVMNSPAVGQQYSNNQDCRVRFVAEGIIKSVYFDTQENNDVLTIDGFSYSGSLGPVWERVDRSSTFHWTSDASITGLGFMICYESTITAYRPHVIDEDGTDNSGVTWIIIRASIPLALLTCMGMTVLYAKWRISRRRRFLAAVPPRYVEHEPVNLPVYSATNPHPYPQEVDAAADQPPEYQQVTETPMTEPTFPEAENEFFENDSTEDTESQLLLLPKEGYDALQSDI